MFQAALSNVPISALVREQIACQERPGFRFRDIVHREFLGRRQDAKAKNDKGVSRYLPANPRQYWSV
jgi:hypothetical protein